MEERLKTERLVLRPFTLDDAPRVCALVGNWNVARMLARVAYPYSQDQAEQWISRHDAVRSSGAANPFAIEKDGELVGCVGLDRDDENKTYEVGFWIGEPYWNDGIATEACGAIIDHAFTSHPVDHLTAGHMTDNHASGRVLTKLGFRYTSETLAWSEARREKVPALRMVLERRNG